MLVIHFELLQKVSDRHRHRLGGFEQVVHPTCNLSHLYQNVDDTSINKVSKEVIKVVSKASSTTLEKATDDDVAGFQYYTIRNLDNKLNTI